MAEESQDRSNDSNDTHEIPVADNVEHGVTIDHLAILRRLFESFNDSTDQLRHSYNVLQEKIEQLDLALEEKNRELSASLTEQERLSNYLTSILESLSSGVLAVDGTGTITLFNRGAENLTGVSEHDAIGSPYRTVMGEDIPDNLTPLPLLEGGEGLAEFEKRITAADGRRIPVGCSVSPLVTISGERIGAVEIFMDLSRIIHLEDELARRERLAMLGRMAATMAHKIRNPLGGIAGFAGLLGLEFKGNPGALRMVKKIEEGVFKLNRIITSLLEYSATRKLETRNIDPAMHIRELPVIGGSGAQTCEILIDEPLGQVTVEADHGQLEAALDAVISNAVDACADGGSVVCTMVNGDAGWTPDSLLDSRLMDRMWDASGLLAARMPCVVIVVSDNGIGMSAEELHNLFVPFYTTKENGIGLGLSHALKIVEAHNGELWIESEPGAGTSVAMVLPRLHVGIGAE